MCEATRKTDVKIIREALKNVGLHIVSKNEIDKLADVAMDAYENYPLHNWFCGGTYNLFISKIIMKISLKSMFDNGVIYADSPELNGFAIWLPPPFSGNKTLPFLFNGGIKLILKSGLGIIAKLLKYENYAMSLKKKYTNHEDWYLFNLSVAKKSQNRGIASKLLRPMLEVCDSGQFVCYLETNKEANVPMYEHFGFELAHQGVIPGTTVNHYAMVRKKSIKS